MTWAQGWEGSTDLSPVKDLVFSCGRWKTLEAFDQRRYLVCLIFLSDVRWLELLFVVLCLSNGCFVELLKSVFDSFIKFKFCLVITFSHTASA